MDGDRKFSMKELVAIGILSGLTVSVVKLIQVASRVADMSSIEIWGTIVTYVGYLFLGAVGAVFLVDHEATGQRMLKGAFLMGFVAPSFFLALLNQPITPGTNLREMIERVPKITELFVGSAFAEETKKAFPDKRTEDALDPPETMNLKGAAGSVGKIVVLEKSTVDLGFGAAVWKAFGGDITPANYTYVVGTTDNVVKAKQTAVVVNGMLWRAGKKDISAVIVQPKGLPTYYVTVGFLGSPQKAANIGEAARNAAIKGLEGPESEQAKQAAALMLKGQVVDARAMFAIKQEPK